MAPANLLVYMVESPAPEDLFDGRTEGAVLREALQIAAIDHEYRLATNLELFDRALKSDLLAHVANARSGRAKWPFLHISAHGNTDGIELTDGTFLQWDDLRLRLHPVNEAMDGYLLVSLSSCEGSSGLRMAAWESGPLPFGILFGHREPATWSEMAIGYAAFYHRFIHKNSGFSAAVDAFKAASGTDAFRGWLGMVVQAEWTEYFNRRRSEEENCSQSTAEETDPRRSPS